MVRCPPGASIARGVGSNNDAAQLRDETRSLYFRRQTVPSPRRSIMNGKTKGKKTTVSKDGAAANKPASGKAAAAAADPNVDLSSKDYEKALKKLHVELVKLQLWVAHTGAKVCIVFEGRDGAGKGGTIKAITERVS